MNTNCLVTKLKGSVDAQLPALGVLKLKIAVTGDYSGDSSKKTLINYFDPNAVQAALDSNKDFEMVLSGGNAYWANSYGTESNFGSTLSLSVLKANPSINSYRIVCDADDNNVTITIKNKYNCPVINGDFSDFPEYNNLKSVVYYANPIIIRNLWNFDGDVLDNVKGDLSKCITFTLLNVIVKPAVTSKLNPRVHLACILEDGNGVPYNCGSYSGIVKTWTLGSRQNATFVSFADGMSLSTATDIDNFLIDLSTCHDNTEGVTINKKIQIYSSAQPSSASTQAIQTLKEAGYTNIKVGTTEYITD